VTAREGPPGKERPGAHHNAGPIRKSGPHQDHQPRPAYSRGPRQCGLYASGWRDGFRAGAIDALRRAGRWLPGDPDTWPEIWAALDALADAYTLVGGDD